MEYVDVVGLRVAFQRRGEGPCLLLLHGAVSDSRVWRLELESLSDVFTVVAWDAPGCGESSDPPEHFRLPEYAECLDQFISALGLERPHLVGHSWGSALALELYRLRPSIVRSLVLVGAYAGWAGSLPPDEVAATTRVRPADRRPSARHLRARFDAGLVLRRDAGGSEVRAHDDHVRDPSSGNPHDGSCACRGRSARSATPDRGTNAADLRRR